MVQYTWTNISISNWQFLIPCYHENSQEVVLNTFCSNKYDDDDDDDDITMLMWWRWYNDVDVTMMMI